MAGDEYDETKMTVGTHTLRKTGFLFAVFGTLTRYKQTNIYDTNKKQLLPMDDCAISSAARHDKKTDPQMYYLDAMTRYEEFEMDENLAKANYVAPWKSNFVHCDTTRATLSLDCRYDKAIHRLADDYVARELLVDAEQAQFVTYAKLIQHAIEKKIYNQTFKEKFDHVVEKQNLTEEGKRALWLLYLEGCEANRLHFAGAIGSLTGEEEGGGKWTLSSIYLFIFLHSVFSHNVSSSKRRQQQN